MSRLRAQVTIPYTSGLPEDVSTNVWHFTGSDADPTGSVAEIVTLLSRFYSTDTGAAGTTPTAYYSSLVSRGANACTIDVFDLADLEPRIPIGSGTFTATAAGAATAFPMEVALCLSFQGTPVSGTPQARRRGRVYLGPFNGNAGVSSTGRPAAALISQIATSADRMLSESDANTLTKWQVYSRVADAMALVVDGWIDDEWDTQRRRGRAATTRSTFT